MQHLFKASAQGYNNRACASCAFISLTYRRHARLLEHVRLLEEIRYIQISLDLLPYMATYPKAWM